MKLFMAQVLRNDPDVSDVRTEQVTFGEVAAGQWRRPDVSCVFRGHRIVFEIQLTYTFLSAVLEREAFYRREGTNLQALEITSADVVENADFCIDHMAT